MIIHIKHAVLNDDDTLVRLSIGPWLRMKHDVGVLLGENTVERSRTCGRFIAKQRKICKLWAFKTFEISVIKFTDISGIISQSSSLIWWSKIGRAHVWTPITR